MTQNQLNSTTEDLVVFSWRFQTIALQLTINCSGFLILPWSLQTILAYATDGFLKRYIHKTE